MVQHQKTIMDTLVAQQQKNKQGRPPKNVEWRTELSEEVQARKPREWGAGEKEKMLASLVYCLLFIVYCLLFTVIV